MMSKLTVLMLLCGLAVVLAFISFMLVPLISDVRASQEELQMLELRIRFVPSEILPDDAFGERVHVLDKDEFFASLAYIRVAARSHNLDVTAFAASDAYSLGTGVSETVVRATLTGCITNAIEYLYYLVGGVYNVRYFSLVNAETASFDVWISIFHR